MTTEQSTASTDRTEQQEHTSPVSTQTMRYLYLSGLALAVMIAFVSVIQAYISAGNAINEFVSDEYRPVFQTGFNLVVLLLSAIVIVRLGGQLDALSADRTRGAEQSSTPPVADPETEPGDAVEELDGDEKQANAEPDHEKTAATDWGEDDASE